MSFDIFAGRADLASLVELIRLRRPDGVSLSEAGDTFRSRLAPLVEALGYLAFYASTNPRTPDMKDINSALVYAQAEPVVSVTMGAEAWLAFVEAQQQQFFRAPRHCGCGSPSMRSRPFPRT